jgi:hypothetical protein
VQNYSKRSLYLCQQQEAIASFCKGWIFWIRPQRTENSRVGSSLPSLGSKENRGWAAQDPVLIIASRFSIDGRPGFSCPEKGRFDDDGWTWV